jgi:hypothetical protein
MKKWRKYSLVFALAIVSLATTATPTYAANNDCSELLKLDAKLSPPDIKAKILNCMINLNTK